MTATVYLVLGPVSKNNTNKSLLVFFLAHCCCYYCYCCMGSLQVGIATGQRI